jgi:hypothetical protein
MSEYENARKRANAIKLADKIVTQFLYSYVPKACQHEAVRCLELKLLENDLYIMDEQTKAFVRQYEKTALKLSNLEVKSLFIKDQPDD